MNHNFTLLNHPVKSCRVRAKVASNLKATDAILDSLSKDKDSYVRQNVAKNPSNSGKVLDYLSHDKSDSVRFEVARNENTPEEVREYLRNALPKNTWAQTPTIEMLHDYYDYEDDD